LTVNEYNFVVLCNTAGRLSLNLMLKFVFWSQILVRTALLLLLLLLLLY